MILDRLAAGLTHLADLVRGAPVATRERVRLAGAGTPSTVVHALAVRAEPSDDIAGLEFRSIAASSSPLRSRAKGASAAAARGALLHLPLPAARRGHDVDAAGATGPFEIVVAAVSEGNRVFVREGGHDFLAYDAERSFRAISGAPALTSGAGKVVRVDENA